MVQHNLHPSEARVQSSSSVYIVDTDHRVFDTQEHHADPAVEESGAVRVVGVHNAGNIRPVRTLHNLLPGPDDRLALACSATCPARRCFAMDDHLRRLTHMRPTSARHPVDPGNSIRGSCPRFPTPSQYISSHSSQSIRWSILRS